MRMLWVALLLLASPFCLAQERPVRVGVVDMLRLIDNAPQMAAAKARLTREFAERDEQLKAQQERLRQLELSQRTRAGPPGSEEFERLAREIDVLRRSVERTRDRLRDELATRNREENDRVWQQINDAVAQYARDNDIDLVLPTPVLHVSARVDITDRVLDTLRQQARDAQQ